MCYIVTLTYISKIYFGHTFLTYPLVTSMAPFLFSVSPSSTSCPLFQLHFSYISYFICVSKA